MKLFTVEQRRRLLEEELYRIIETLKREYDPEKIILFGSLTKDNIHEWSDIDLVIIKKTSKRMIDRILEVTQLVNPKVGIDLFIYTPDEFAILVREKSPFIMKIVKEGKVLYEKGN